jgi:hypothetical protein
MQDDAELTPLLKPSYRHIDEFAEERRHEPERKEQKADHRRSRRSSAFCGGSLSEAQGSGDARRFAFAFASLPFQKIVGADIEDLR